MKMVSAIILPGADTIRNVIAKSITLSGRYYFSDPTFAKTDSLYRSTINKIVYFYCKDSAWPILISTCDYDDANETQKDALTTVSYFPLDNHPLSALEDVSLAVFPHNNFLKTIDTDVLSMNGERIISLSTIGVSLDSTDGQISVDCHKAPNNEGQLLLCDIIGRVIQSTPIEKDHPVIFTDLPSGYYVVAVKTAETIASERIYVK